MLLAAALICRRSIGNDRRLGGTPRPASAWPRANGSCRPTWVFHRQRPPPGQNIPGPSWWARADAGSCPPQGLHRHRPPHEQASPSPQLVGPPPWGLPFPVGAPDAATAAWAQLSVPPAFGPAPITPVVSRRCSIGSGRLLGGTPCPSSWARGDGSCRPLWMIHRRRPPPGKDSPSPLLLGPR